ncbi:MAG: CoA transferase [Betaproteobacteria bacterium]|nr:CoA transferase [Betaproteobacteria bacterium]
MRPKPLHDIRVLDLTRLLPGPVATLHLADMGADVIKIEDTGAGDYARAMGRAREGMSGIFRLLNRNKRGLRLDLKQPAGRDVFLRLTEDADVIVEGFRPGVMSRLGLGYESLAAINPRIVYCSISGYGQDGPYRERAGHDINYVGYAGVGDQIGAEGGEPVVPNFQIADLLGGALTPVMGMLAALVDAKASGKGRYVDVSMTDATFAHALWPLFGLLEEGRTPARGTTRLSGGLPCYGHYATSDARHMAVGALEPKFWQALCEALGCPELKDEHLVYGSRAAPVKARLAAIFASHTQQYWAERLAKVDCCVTPVLTIEESLENEQLRARAMVVEENGSPRLALPVKFSEFEFAIERPAPRPGEHSEEILRTAGYGADEIAALRSQKVI